MGYYPGNDLNLGTIVGSDEPLTLSRQDRARHSYMVGASRTGKTKLLEGIGRQDLLKWSEDHCPMVVIDPADTLYDGLMGYAAAEDLKEWPIIPFDLRRDDLIVSYDLLKKRKGIRPAVICRALVEAIVHAWGQTNTLETPRLASMLESVLMVAVEKECTIAQALAMILDPGMRAVLLTEVQHMVARTTLKNAHFLGEKGFQENVQSSMFRINTFLTNVIIEATLCARTGQSLDLADVLEKGKILLVCLSVAKANISTADAAAVGSVLLTDLWTAAKRRGKAEEGERAPCYVHIDEFQNFLTPDIAIGLTEASGYGLHLTLAHQYPSQLPDRGGQLGKMILNAVLGTAKNKFAFQTEHPQDLDLLAQVFGRQMVDLNKVKQEIWSTKVVGYKLAYLPGFTESTTDGVTHSEQWGNTHVLGHTATKNWNDSIGMAEMEDLTEGKSEGEKSENSANAGITITAGDVPSSTQQNSPATVDPTEEADRVHAGLLAEQEVGGDPNVARNWGFGGSTGKQSSRNQNKRRGISVTTTHTGGGSEADIEQIGESYGGGIANSHTATKGKSLNPMLLPKMEKELVSRECESKDDQLYRIAQFLDAQPDRHCLVRLASKRQPAPLYTATIEPPLTTTHFRDKWVTSRLRQLPFVLSLEEAHQQIADRKATLKTKLGGMTTAQEPSTARRKVKPER